MARTVDMICGGDFVANVESVTKVGDGTFRFAPTTGIAVEPSFPEQRYGDDFQIGQPTATSMRRLGCRKLTPPGCDFGRTPRAVAATR